MAASSAAHCRTQSPLGTELATIAMECTDSRDCRPGNGIQTPRRAHRRPSRRSPSRCAQTRAHMRTADRIQTDYCTRNSRVQRRMKSCTNRSDTTTHHRACAKIMHSHPSGRVPIMRGVGDGVGCAVCGPAGVGGAGVGRGVGAMVKSALCMPPSSSTKNARPHSKPAPSERHTFGLDALLIKVRHSSSLSCQASKSWAHQLTKAQSLDDPAGPMQASSPTTLWLRN